MDDELKYLIALSSIYGIGPAKARLLMARQESCANFRLLLILLTQQTAPL